MGLWNVQLRKAINSNGIAYKWSNRYFVDKPTPEEALLQAQNLWVFGERSFHGALVFCYEVYANLVGDTPFTPGYTAAVPAGNQRGSITQAAGDTLFLLPS